MPAAFATFDAAPGQELRWDAVLAELAIRGRLLDDDRAPLAGWQVTASGQDGGVPHLHATTGSAGEFVLHGCAAATYTLACSTAAWNRPVFTVPDVYWCRSSFQFAR